MKKNKSENQKKYRIVSSELIMWNKNNQYDYPWRNTNDAYKILITEILLRKTTRTQVKKVYETFFKIFPNIESICKSNKNKIKEVIYPLGMSNIKSHAIYNIMKRICENYNGTVPLNRDILIGFPHIGPYIANAVLCFTKNTNVPLIDTNFIRIVDRVFCVNSIKKRARNDQLFWEIGEKMVPKDNAKLFNIAILDFGAAICKSKRPLCDLCPISSICEYLHSLDHLDHNSSSVS